MNKKPNFYVVGIGASAGGLDAIQKLFDHVPDNTGMAFIIIQHLSPDFKSLMPELLSKHTNMSIYTAKDKQIIKPNCIYLNQRNKNLHIKGKKLYLLDKGPKHNLNLPIDIFFHTLGEEYKEKAIGVILSGTGSDGSRGIRTIKEGAGTIVVQDPVSAQFDGMPNSAITTNIVDYILSPEKIAEVFYKKPINRPLLTKDFDENLSHETLINDILTIVYKYSGIDFREYKKNTLLRRLEKRMNINNIDRLFDYATFLASNVSEKQALQEDFLIGVTRFFRDTEAFNRLKRDVVPNICKSKTGSETIRIWIAGCSTGEEVYSIAILFDDYIRTHKLNLDFKIFATDIDPRGLTVASSGIYHINIVNELEKKYLDQYFLKIGDKIQIIKRIREKIVFSNHNIINDPPFIRMDLISCRNLLIYLDNKIQKKVMYNFQFALNHYAYLFLGNSESLGELSKLFKTMDVKWKIFQNISATKQIPDRKPPLERIGTLNYKSAAVVPPEVNYKRLVTRAKPQEAFNKYLNKKYSPATIFIDKDFNILFTSGEAGKRLTQNDGVFENNLLKVVSPDIASVIRSGIRRVESEKQDVLIKGLVNRTENQNYTFDLTFYSTKDDDTLNGYYLIEFSSDKALKKEDPLLIKNIDLGDASSQRLEDLETELKVVKTELQNAIEELETSNEELQSSNEELMASNEELQSTNEELQSVNEELYTVNSEMQEKNKELTNLSNDVSNLLDNTNIATLFLDTDLRIREFTPALKQVFNLQEEDLGRPLASFTSNFNEATRIELIENAKLVIDKLMTIEKQVEDQENNFYLQRISPFITQDKTIDGVVITLNNINKLKDIEQELAETDLRYHKLFENLNEGFIHGKIITNKKGEPIDWEYIDVNSAYEKIIGKTASELIGNTVSSFFPELINDPNKWIQTYGKTALTGESQTVEGYVSELDKHFYVNVFSHKEGEFAGTISDVTNLKRKELALSKSEVELKRVQKITKVGSWYFDLKTNEVEWTKQLYEIYELDPSQPAPPYSEHPKLYSEASWKRVSDAVENTIKTGEPYDIELNMFTSKNREGWILAHGEAVKNEEGEIIALRGAAQDITQQKRNEEELINAKRAAEAANIHKNYFLANMSHEIRTPMNSVLGFSKLLKSDELAKQDRQKYLEIIDSNSKQLLNLIDDIIDVAKIESNEIKMVYKECHIPNLINNLEITYNELKIVRGKEDITFKTTIPKKHKDLTIITDGQRLQQVISNLLNNALKFSEEGMISFGFNVKDNYLKFFVKDEGIGIEKGKLLEIFERFKQINYENNAKYGGTGLGLAICRGIVTLLGGHIDVTSEYNVGTSFEFTIPLKLSNAKEGEDIVLPVKDDFLKGKTLLIAEDDALIQLLFKIVLKNTGANLIFARTGKEALNSYNTNSDIDLILLDIRMPEMNGVIALQKILEINPKAKIIMQTAYAMPEEKEKCFDIGCIDFLSKPVIKEELFATLNKWVN